MNEIQVNKTLTIIVLVVLLLTPVSFAAGPTPTAISDHNMVKDLSSNSLNQYTPSGTYTTDLFTGSFAYSYPIAVPSGVNGLQPNIAFNYNHHQTALKGVLGNSWSLTQNYIYRDTKGTLEYIDDDVFKLHFNGVDIELIYSTSDNKYYTEMEYYWKIEKKSGGDNNLGDYWTLKTKDGTRYRFGYNHNSEFLSKQGIIFSDWPEFVSMWSLDSTADMHGNSVFYNYNKNPSSDNYPYLSQISYNNGINIIKFNYDYDTFNGFNGYAYGAKIKQNALLNNVEINNSDNLVRRYKLEYNDISNKKFLNKIKLIGSDDISELPSIEFNYNSLSKGWNSASNYLVPSEAYFGEYKDNGVRLLDINGDGFDDVIKMYNTNNMDYWLNNKNNGWQQKQTYSNLLEGGIVNDWGQDLGVRFFDFDGDTKIDIIKLLKDQSTVKKLLTNSGNDWEEKNMTIPDEINFIKKQEATVNCEPPPCIYDYTDEGVSCSNGSCTRTCSVLSCTGSETVVMDDYSTEPDWDSYYTEYWDRGERYNPSENKCYKFEFTGSQETDSDDSECYDLYTYDEYYDDDYDKDCIGEDIDAYAAIGFVGIGSSNTWLRTVPGDPNGMEYGYTGDVPSDNWEHMYISKYDKDGNPDTSGSNKGDWDGFNNEICDEAGTHTIYCTPTYAACDLWNKERCGYGCAGERTYPFVVMGLYASYNNNLWDALYENWDCNDDMIEDNDYFGENNHYKVTEYSMVTHYDNQQCNYAVDEYMDTAIRLADINADGKVDILKSTNTEKKVWLNTGDDFIPISSWEIPAEAVFLDINDKKDEGTRIADVNGDGLPDLVKGKDSTRITWINTGKGWVQNDDWIIPAGAVFTANEQDKGVVFVDIDGDRLIDILRADSLTRKAWINTGNGWTEDSSWSIPSSVRFAGPSSTIADFNGDGLPDLVMAKSSGNRNAWSNRASQGYLLNNVKNMYGGTTTINYKKITSIDNTGEDNINDLPFSGWVVGSITKNNGLSGVHQVISTTNYNYFGGLYDSDDKEFRGFKYVNEILPSGSIIKHSFNQDKARKGLEYESGIYDDNGNIYSRNIFNWFGQEEIIHSYESDYQVIYRTNILNSSYGGQYRDLYKDNWIAFDKNKDGNLEGYGYSGHYVFQCSNCELTETILNDGWKLGYDRYYDDILRVFEPDCQNPKTEDCIQGIYKSGRPSAQNAVLSKKPTEPYTTNNQEVMGWRLTDKNIGTYTLTLNSIENHLYDGNPNNPEITKTQFQYDSYGNIIKTSYLGDISKTGDEKYQYNEYLYNTNEWIVDKPKRSYLRDYTDSTQVSESKFRYDGRSYGSYPTKGDLTYTEQWLNTGSNPTESYIYDSYGNVKSYTNPRGYVTSYDYDSTHTFLTNITNAKNHKTDYLYDTGTGNLLSVTDPNGYISEYKYDMFGRKIKEILPYDTEDYPTVEIQYNMDGTAPEKIKVMQREVNGTSQTYDSYDYYDGFENIVQTKKESASSQLITKDTNYDNMFRLKEETNPYFSVNGYTSPSSSIKKSVYSYDPVNRITQIINPDNTIKTVNYNKWNTTVYNENNKRKDYIHDAYNRIISIKEYNGGEVYETFYEYDTIDNLRKITDEQGNEIIYNYDSLGRKTQLQDPDMGSWIYNYDKNDNLISQKDTKSNSITLQYDELSRLKVKSTSGITANYYYDSETVGMLYRLTYPDLNIYFNYDGRLRLTNEEKNIDSVTFNTAYNYDSMDRLVSKELPDGSALTYSYDNQGLVDSIGNLLTNVDYNELNQPTHRAYDNGLTTNFQYKSNNYRLDSLTTGNKQHLSYDYDDIGNVMSISDSITSKTSSFQYDDLDRLTHAQRSSDFDIDYSYDSIGNMLSAQSDKFNISFSYGNLPVHSPVSLQYSNYCDNDWDGHYGALCNGNDCDDDNESIHPGATEVCNGLDDNCDGNSDEEDSFGCIVYYKDGDKDEYGQSDDNKCLCSPYDPYDAIYDNDCNDNNENINPDISEVCDSIDNNCNNVIDEEGAIGCATYYKDEDRDGYGSTDYNKCLCSSSNPYDSSDNRDCDDSNENILPGAEELCNFVDDNCDGEVDEGCCYPDWKLDQTSCEINDKRLISYTDANNCNVSDDLPLDNGTYGYCDYCTSEWVRLSSNCKPSDYYNRNYQYTNTCCAETGLESDCNIPQNTTAYCDYCTPLWRCNGYLPCNTSDLRSCNSVSDLKYCYIQTGLLSDKYWGDYLEFSPRVCDYCTPSWYEIETNCQINDTITGYYEDSNTCYEQTGLESDNNIPDNNIYACDYCAPGWYEINSSCNVEDTITGHYEDSNTCYEITQLSSDNNPPGDNIYVCDYCTPDWGEINESCQPSDTFIGWYDDSNDCYAQTGLESDNNVPDDNTYVCDYCTPDWYEIRTSCQINDTITGHYEDYNTCYETTALESDNNIPDNNIYSCDYCTPSWYEVNTSCRTDDSKTGYYLDENSCYETTSLESDIINKPDNNTYTCDYCTPSWDCNGYWPCNTSDLQSCNSVDDSNKCYEQTGLSSDEYVGDYWEFEIQSCDYCTPSWYEIETSCQINDTITGYYEDSNTCYEQTGLESDNNVPDNNIYTCDYCNPDWYEIKTSCQSNDTITGWYNDSNYCYDQTGLESDNNIPANNIYTCDYCAPDWDEINESCQSSDTFIGWYDDSHDCYTQTGLESDNNAPDDNTYTCDYCTPSWYEINTSCRTDDSKTGYYLDENSCYETTGLTTDIEYKPDDNIYTCDYCTPAWSCDGYVSCNTSDLQSCNSVADSNSCYEQTSLPSDEYSGDYSEFQIQSCDYCTPDWYETKTSCQTNDTITGWYNDSNYCYEQTGLESDNNIPDNNIYTCDYCTPAWYEINSSCNTDDTITGHYEDPNTCYEITGLDSDNNIPDNNIYACDYCTPDWYETKTSCQLNDTITGYYEDYNTCYEITQLSSDNNPPANNVYDCDYCTPYWYKVNTNCQTDDTITEYHIDDNSCYEQTGLKSDNIPPEGNIYACDYCTPSWYCGGYWPCNILDLQSCNSADDSNECYGQTGLSSDEYAGDYLEFKVNNCDYCTPDWYEINTSCQNDEIIGSYSDSNQCYVQTGLNSDNNAPDDNTYYCGDTNEIEQTEPLETPDPSQTHIVVYTSEPDLPVLNETEIQNVRLTVKNKDSKIEFTESINLSNITTLRDHVYIEGAIVAIDTSGEYYKLNKSARITLTDVVYDRKPKIYYNVSSYTLDPLKITTECPVSICTLESYTPPPTTQGTVVFDVAHFSSYWVGIIVTQEDLENDLIISDLDVKVGSKTDRNLNDGDKISKKAEPGDKVVFDIELTNTFVYDWDIEDIKIEITIEDIDDGDLDEEDRISKIKGGRKENAEIEFEIPEIVEEGKYDVIIYIKGEDEDNKEYEIIWNLKLKVEKENHRLILYETDLLPSTVECSRYMSLDVGVRNIGGNDEEVDLSITSAELDIDETKSFELNDGTDDDSEYEKRFNFNIAEDIEAGSYPIYIKAGYDDETETETVYLRVKDCIKIIEKEDRVKVEATPTQEVIPSPPQTTQIPPKKVSFEYTNGYLVLLSIISVILVILLLHLIRVAIRSSRKR